MEESIPLPAASRQWAAGPQLLRAKCSQRRASRVMSSSTQGCWLGAEKGRRKVLSIQAQEAGTGGLTTLLYSSGSWVTHRVSQHPVPVLRPPAALLHCLYTCAKHTGLPQMLCFLPHLCWECHLPTRQTSPRFSGTPRRASPLPATLACLSAPGALTPGI